MLLSPIIMVVGAVVLSGAIYKHQTILTYLSMSALLWEMGWLFATLLDRTIFANTPTEFVYLSVSILFVVAALYAARSFGYSFPVKPGWYEAKQELSIIFVIAIVVVGACVVWYQNGFKNNEWIAHSFFNGDTVTFMSLIQRSASEAKLVQENPFAGNGSLEYPTLLHAGIASLLPRSEPFSGWIYLLPAMTYVWIFATIPMLFVMWQALSKHVAKNPIPIWLTVGIILYVLAVSWDGYIYPQSHFFLTGLFLLTAFLLHCSFHTTNNRLQHVYAALGGLTALTLVYSNAVSGTAALVLWIAYTLVKPRPTSLIGAAVLVSSFLIASPGNAGFGSVHFSYEATGAMLRFGLAFILVLASLAAHKKKTPFIAVSTALLGGASLAVFFFSDREIVRENATRFLYHGILIAFPLIASYTKQIQDLLDTAKKELVSRTVLGAVPLISLVMCLVLLFLPAGASVIHTQRNLWGNDKHVTGTAERLAYWWIEDNTNSDAIFLADPNEPFGIPAFTGRALLRTNYWLSPEDIVLEDVNAAFAGDKAAQEMVIPQADYIYLTKNNRALFEPLPDSMEKVLDTNAIAIYKIAR